MDMFNDGDTVLELPLETTWEDILKRIGETSNKYTGVIRDGFYEIDFNLTKIFMWKDSEYFVDNRVDLRNASSGFLLSSFEVDNV